MYIFFMLTLLFCQGLAAMLSLIKWNELKTSHFKYLSMYLVFIFLSELTGFLLGEFGSKRINQDYYNFIVIPIEFLFFFWLYLMHAKSNYLRNVIFKSVVIYLSVFFIENFFLSEKSFLSISYMFGSFFLLIIIFGYLFWFIRKGDLENIRFNPLIYISIGLLVFYMGSFPYYGLKNYLWTEYKVIGNNYWYVVTSLNCFMYCMFTISLLCNYQKSTSL